MNGGNALTTDEHTQVAHERRATARGGDGSWRAGYVILPLAALVGLCQLLVPTDLIPSDLVSPWLIPAHRERVAGNEGRAQEAVAATPPAVSEPAADAGGAEANAEPAPVRVLIHHPAGARNALPAMQLATYLQGRGFVVDAIRAVEFEVERPSVRYFFASDQPDTDRLVEAVGDFLAEEPVRAPAEADDFRDAPSKPERGSMEVWLPPVAAAVVSRSS